jgi:hypothetical protein
MLKLELRGRPLFRLYSQLLLSLRVGVSHSYTRTIVELLGPCFKTGRLYVPLLTTYGKPEGVTPIVQEKHRALQMQSKTRSRTVEVMSSNLQRILCRYGSRTVASPLAISGILTLLSKYFSTFPHGTCLLSISR